VKDDEAGDDGGWTETTSTLAQGEEEGHSKGMPTGLPSSSEGYFLTEDSSTEPPSKKQGVDAKDSLMQMVFTAVIQREQDNRERMTEKGWQRMGASTWRSV
jgi:hypothetical protein